MPEFLKVVTPGEAKARFAAAYTPRPGGTERVPLRLAYRRVLAHDVVSLDDLPEFDKSTVDGYAVRAEDLDAASQTPPVSLAVVGEVQMGEAPHVDIGPQLRLRVDVRGRVDANAHVGRLSTTVASSSASATSWPSTNASPRIFEVRFLSLSSVSFICS